MRIRDIPQFTRHHYEVNQPWVDIYGVVNRYVSKDGLQLIPNFQRGHVWTKTQQIAYVEFGLRGGRGAMHLHFNHPGWMGSFEGEFVLVDGLQRLTAVMRFVGGEIPAFGLLYPEYEDRLSYLEPNFLFCINNLKTRAEVLQWYIDLNAGGIAHSEEEIIRVRNLLEQEKK